MAGASAWRANDVVAYEVMRESATALTALLLRSASTEDTTGVEFDGEVRQLRRRVYSVDSFDRAAVASMTAEISLRTRELTESKP